MLYTYKVISACIYCLINILLYLNWASYSTKYSCKEAKIFKKSKIFVPWFLLLIKIFCFGRLCHTFHSWCAVHLKTGCQNSQGIHKADVSLCNYSSYIRAQLRKCYLPICSIIWIKNLQYLLPNPVGQEHSCALLGNA